MTRWNKRTLLVFTGGIVCLLIGVAFMQPFGWHGSARADDPKADEGKPAPLDADKIGTAAGAKATTTPDGVVRIGWPRTDVAVKVDGDDAQTVRRTRLLGGVHADQAWRNGHGRYGGLPG